MRTPFALALMLTAGLAAADSYSVQAARLRHADPVVRIDALSALAKHRDYRALEDVARLLRRELRPEVRRLAIRTLLAYSDESTLGRLFFQAGDAYAFVAADVPASELAPHLKGFYGPYAAFTLGELGDREAIPSLFDALDGAQGRQLFYAADALRKLRAPGLAERLIFPSGSPSQHLVTPILENLVCRESVPDLVAAYRGADADTQARLVSLIGRVPNAGAVDFLHQVLPPNPENEFRKLNLRFSLHDSASKKLWATANPCLRPSMPFLMDIYWSRHPDPAMKDRYLQRLRGGKPEHLAEVITVLGKLRVEAARPAIEQRLIASNYGDTVAAHALARIGNPRSLPVVIKGLKRDSLPKGYVEAIAAFGPAAIDSLLEATYHPRSGVRAEALAALGKMKVRRAWKRVARMVQDDPDLGGYALITLGELGEPQAIPLLIAHQEASPEIVTDALSSLWPASRPVLLAGLKGLPRIRTRCARALGVAKDRSAVPALLQGLLDPELRQEAAIALGRIGDPRAAPALIRCMDSVDVELRKHAAVALAQIGDRRALPRLGALARDPNPAVRHLGHQAVTAIVWPSMGVKLQ